MPSILRGADAEQEWVEEGVLPRRHDRAVYSAAWSKLSGRVVSAGGDGRVVVYGEREAKSQGESSTAFAAEPAAHSTTKANAEPPGGETHDPTELETDPKSDRSLETPVANGLTPATEWVVLAELEAAHGVFEVNHVCWAKRWDKGRTGGGAGDETRKGEGGEGEKEVEEEVIITTGDDGGVRVWSLETIT